MQLVTGVPRAYDWGSDSAIHRVMGTEPDGAPLAELWFGAHSSGPALTLNGRQSVRSLIAEDPVGTLGRDVLSRFGAQLPYLLKLIAPQKPLSLQVHPNRSRAQMQFDVENWLGVPLDSPHRNYRDANHKPELLLALSPFRALCGFREPRQVAASLKGLGSPFSRMLYEILTREPTNRGLREAFNAVLTRPTSQVISDAAEFAEACQLRIDRGSPSRCADATVVELAREFPGDRGVIASVMLNTVSLRPGEALFVPAGQVHAYLSGTGVEVMASSDNVLRAGLTKKHVDVPEMLGCVDFSAVPPVRVEPVMEQGTEIFRSPVQDFELSFTRLEGAIVSVDVLLPGQGPRILLCIRGGLEVSSTAGRMSLRRGEAAFIRADAGPLEVRGEGEVIQVYVP